MMSGLAYYLSQKYSPDRSQELERRYESELLRALDADNQGTSTFISAICLIAVSAPFV